MLVHCLSVEYLPRLPLQAQADRALRYITHVDKANESVGQKLNRARKVIGNIITLLDDVQEERKTSKRSVEKGRAMNDGIQATLQSLKKTRGCSCHET